MSIKGLLKRILGLDPLSASIGVDLNNHDDSSSSSEDEGDEEHAQADQGPPPKRRLSYKRAPPGVFNPQTGNIERVDPMDTTWAKWYVKSKHVPAKDLPKKTRDKFRRRLFTLLSSSGRINYTLDYANIIIQYTR